MWHKIVSFQKSLKSPPALSSLSENDFFRREIERRLGDPSTSPEIKSRLISLADNLKEVPQGLTLDGVLKIADTYDDFNETLQLKVSYKISRQEYEKSKNEYSSIQDTGDPYYVYASKWYFLNPVGMNEFDGVSLGLLDLISNNICVQKCYPKTAEGLVELVMSYYEVKEPEVYRGYERMLRLLFDKLQKKYGNEMDVHRDVLSGIDVLCDIDKYFVKESLFRDALKQLILKRFFGAGDLVPIGYYYDHNHAIGRMKKSRTIPLTELHYPSTPLAKDSKTNDIYWIKKFVPTCSTVSTPDGITFTDPTINVKDMPNFKLYQHRLLTLYYATAIAEEITKQYPDLKKDPHLFRLSMRIARFALSGDGDLSGFIKNKIQENVSWREKLLDKVEGVPSENILKVLEVMPQKYREIVALEEGLFLCYLTKDMLETLGVLKMEPDIAWKEILKQVDTLSKRMDKQKFFSFPGNPSNKKMKILLGLMRAMKHGVPMGLFKFQNEPLFEIFRPD